MEVEVKLNGDEPSRTNSDNTVQFLDQEAAILTLQVLSVHGEKCIFV